MKTSTNATRFGLIRHAPTEWNRIKRIQGVDDSPLIPEGRILAEKWGRILADHPWDLILSSNLGRALETARLVNLALVLAIEQDGRLREMDWGQWTGKTIKQVKKEHPGVLARAEEAGWLFRAPGGEDRREVLDRGLKALEDAAGRRPGTNILVVTHEGLIKCLVYHLAGRAFKAEEPPLLMPARLHRIALDDSGWQLEKVNALALD